MEPLHLGLLVGLLLLCNPLPSRAFSSPLNCTDTTRLCTSFLAVKSNPNLTFSLIQSMFDVLPGDITVDVPNATKYFFIRKNCSCLSPGKNYLTNTTFTVREEGQVYDMVTGAYGPLALISNSSHWVQSGTVVSLRLLCGCSSGLWNYLMTYVLGGGETIGSLASQFGVSMGSIESLNGIADPNDAVVGEVYYIPLNSVPGVPYSVEEVAPPASAPVPSISSFSVNPEHHSSKFPFGWIIGSLGMTGDAFEMEKPVVFAYEEILSSTNGFCDTNLLGHGTYGSVYYGVLREQNVRYQTKEFMAEMKVLCKVHHASLVELIGYAASSDELFLIYEYAQKGSLRNHLHDPQNKGHTSLSWIARVQIALDTAKGLEYIHEHTKMHYVHRDIKTSNILLDGSFRAKISDFGLSKLIGKAGEGEASATRVVGTFGYLAPEYLRDGRATTKSDVYAFGVVLFELISGKEAIIRTEGVILNNAERRSLASVMLAALRNTPNSMSMSSFRGSIDPNLMELYPHDCVFKMAILAKQCVDEDPILRPDMKQVVISISHILLSSIEWEATLAGNSQVFSGLVQGR
ncbi:unnamed protein product [Spirodela intermedia]|uniref:Uncharacterized protein n=1 Tax=Spirodela intermedia TaxID=51605 RepID=A0A7I8J733_SPIIN|nr:unnamed protein product [Spirodela intermedia]CAA6666058.1 unnamed protein product [Spirodela intermedia]